MDGRLLSINQSVSDITGYGKEELLRLTCQEITHPDDRQEDLEKRKALTDAKTPTYSIEKRLLRQDGTTRWVNVTVSLVHKDDATPDYLISFIEDISERKRLQHELDRSFKKVKEEELRKDIALQTGTIGGWEWEFNSNAVIWDETMYKIYGISTSQGENPYAMWSDTLDTQDIARVEQALFGARESDGLYDTQFWITTPSLERRYIHAIGQNEFDKDGHAYRMVGINIDITEYQDMLDEMTHQQEKYRRFMRLASDGIFILDTDGRLIEHSDVVSRLLGHSDDELRYLSVYDWDKSLTKDDFKGIVNSLSEGPITIERVHTRRDGSTYDASITAVKMTIDDKDHIYSSVRDITDQKKAEQELLAAKEQAESLLLDQKNLLSLFDKGDSILFKWKNDAHWSVAYVSDNVSRLLGYSKEEFFDQDITYAACIHPDDVGHVSKEVESAIRDDLDFFRHDPYRIITKEGVIKWVLDYTVTQKDASGDIEYFIGYITDFTDQKKQEHAIQEKLQKFIDTQNSIVLLTDGHTIKFANKTFLDFFGYEDLAGFQKEHKCICERFVAQKNFFHLGKVKAGEKHWIESLLNLNGRQRVVSMIDHDSDAFAFTVSINTYEDHDYVVTLNDISDNMMEKLELKKEATQDELTQLYNRIYFHKNIDEIIATHQHDKMKTGVIFCDIDHFKKINDTYGHDIGDYVLYKVSRLVKTHVRDDDKVIRWGGEEFVIILEVQDERTVYRIAEHLRSAIETHQFKNISPITCSFGCALHHSGDIHHTIRVADERLYEAKSNGRNRVE